MAVRDRLQHDENTRKKIQVSQIINRLTKHTLADEDIMTSSQVNAAKVLLGKVLPDLRQSEVTVGAIELTHEEWLTRLNGGDNGSSTSSEAETTPE